eukprot:7389489-Prymnesium_polylepis.2
MALGARGGLAARRVHTCACEHTGNRPPSQTTHTASHPHTQWHTMPSMLAHRPPHTPVFRAQRGLPLRMRLLVAIHRSPAPTNPAATPTHTPAP